MNEVRVPNDVVQMISGEGDDGRRWLADVPNLVADLARRWSLTLGPPYEGGCVAYVAPGERPGGERVVLKVGFPSDETVNEADALATWNGRGAVRLLELDRERNGMLLERAEPGSSLERHPDRDEAISIGCRVLRRVRHELASDHPFPSVRGLVLRWAGELHDEHVALGEPFERSLVDEATGQCRQLAQWSGETFLVNRDFHLGNVLAARREPWLLIDPKPLAGEPAFDTGHFLRTLLEPEPQRSSAERLVARLGAELDLDPERVRAWSFVRSVDDALWALSRGDRERSWYDHSIGCARALRPA